MKLCTAFCPECNNKIHWFLEIPEDYICQECSSKVSVKELDNSWRGFGGDKKYNDWLKSYHEYLEIVGKLND